ncbi:MAG: DUF6326 family protein [Actinomycetota bacterium]
MLLRTANENLLRPRHLSSLWIYVLLSIAFRDIHEFLREGMISELATDGTVRGTPVRDSTLLAAGVAYQLPLGMVLLSRVLPGRANRIANRAASVITAAGILAIWPKDADDLVFGVFQLAALAAIGVICHRWTDDTVESPALADVTR